MFDAWYRPVNRPQLLCVAKEQPHVQRMLSVHMSSIVLWHPPVPLAFASALSHDDAAL